MSIYLYTYRMYSLLFVSRKWASYQFVIKGALSTPIPATCQPAHLADINETNTIWFLSATFDALLKYSDRFMQIATKDLWKKPRLANQLAWLYVQTHFVFWWHFPYQMRKVAFLKHRRHEVKMVHQQMWCLKSLDRLVNGYSELQRPVCAGWSPGEGKRNLTEKCRKLNSGSRFRNYSKLLQMFAMAEVE